MQQALLDAVAWVRRRTPADVLADEYNFPPPNQLLNEVPLFLEISDFAATAARIERILDLRPTGVGYRLTGGRVAEAIGENGEYLQRFVRELGQRVDFIEGDREYRPVIYLGLNGALGHLAHDPVRHVGKILGNCVGLQDAAGSHRLIIEEPFILDDPIGQSANLLRLKDFLRLTPSSQKRPEPTHLVARVLSLTDEEVRIYTDTQAVHGLNFDLLAIGDIDNMMTRLAALRDTSLVSYLSFSSSNDSLLSPRWAATSVDLALASHSAGLILSFDNGNESLYQTIIRHLSETMAWSDHPLSP